ncbi:MAG: HD-GYP domain-containing protein [bacterium]
MSVIIEQLSPALVGKRLGQNLYNATGNLLLRKGVTLTPRFLDYFQEKGYRSIFVLNEDDTEIAGRFNYTSDRLLVSAPYLLKNIFRNLKSEETLKASQARNDLISLAESILVHIRNTLRRPMHLMELKRQDDYLYQHSVYVAVYSIFLGCKLNFHDRKLLSLAISALLHDFGMEFIDERIVNKESRLEDKEFEKVKEHTTKGFTHLVRNCFFDGISSVASVQHHERFDGCGYPNKLQGDAIHEYSRIITVTDFFDAWTSDRPHRRLNSIENALEFLRSNEDKMFDGKLVRSFVEVFE